MHGNKQAKGTLMSRLNHKRSSILTDLNCSSSHLLMFIPRVVFVAVSFTVIRAVSNHISTLCHEHDRHPSKAIMLQYKDIPTLPSEQDVPEWKNEHFVTGTHEVLGRQHPSTRRSRGSAFAPTRSCINHPRQPPPAVID